MHPFGERDAVKSDSRAHRRTAIRTKRVGRKQATKKNGSATTRDRPSSKSKSGMNGEWGSLRGVDSSKPVPFGRGYRLSLEVNMDEKFPAPDQPAPQRCFLKRTNGAFARYDHAAGISLTLRAKQALEPAEAHFRLDHLPQARAMPSVADITATAVWGKEP